jgi:hypothetical protein
LVAADLAGSIWDVAQLSLRQALIPDRLLGRVAAHPGEESERSGGAVGSNGVWVFCCECQCCVPGEGDAVQPCLMIPCAGWIETHCRAFVCSCQADAYWTH